MAFNLKITVQQEITQIPFRKRLPQITILSKRQFSQTHQFSQSKQKKIVYISLFFKQFSFGVKKKYLHVTLISFKISFTRKKNIFLSSSLSLRHFLIHVIKFWGFFQIPLSKVMRTFLKNMKTPPPIFFVYIFINAYILHTYTQISINILSRHQTFTKD